MAVARRSLARCGEDTRFEKDIRAELREIRRGLEEQGSRLRAHGSDLVAMGAGLCTTVNGWASGTGGAGPGRLDRSGVHPYTTLRVALEVAGEVGADEVLGRYGPVDPDNRRAPVPSVPRRQ